MTTQLFKMPINTVLFIICIMRLLYLFNIIMQPYKTYEIDVAPHDLHVKLNNTNVVITDNVNYMHIMHEARRI